MSDNVKKKLDDDSKKEPCVSNANNVEKILKEDEAVRNDKKNERDYPVASEDQATYITKDEDDYSIMINGSF